MADNTYGDNIKSLMTSVVEMPELVTKILIFLVIVFCFVLAVLVIFSTYWNVEKNRKIRDPEIFISNKNRKRPQKNKKQ